MKLKNKYLVNLLTIFAVVILAIPVIPAQDVQAAAADTVEGNSRGYWTTPGELREIKRKATAGIEPYKSAVSELMGTANSGWTGLSSVSGVYSVSDRGTYENHFYRGGSTLYAKAIAFHLSGNESYAVEVRKRIIDLYDITDFSGGDAPIMLGWQLPAWIQSADLLEDWNGWSDSDKRSFQNWLASKVYPEIYKVARTFDNNWGATTTFLGTMIADYITGSGLSLKEGSNSLSPAQVYKEFTEIQFHRIKWKPNYAMDPQRTQVCRDNGIAPNGGIPAELRRADGTISRDYCFMPYLRSINGTSATSTAAYAYMSAHVQGGVISHAELLLRRGNKSLYDYKDAYSTPSILRAIKYVIANPSPGGVSYDFKEYKKSPLRPLYRYYRDNDIKDRLKGGSKNQYGESFKGSYIYFTQLTHGFASGENPALPPTVPAPSDINVPTSSGTPSTPIPTTSRVVTPNPTVGPIEKGKFTGIVNNQVVKDKIYVCYTASDATTSYVEFSIDEKYVNTERSLPLCLGGDTAWNPNGYDISNLALGTHTVSVKVYNEGGTTYTDSVTFVVGEPNCSTSATGDTNCDGLIDLVDFSIFRQDYLDYLAGKITAADSVCDFNKDGRIDLQDYEVFRINFVQTH